MFSSYHLSRNDVNAVQKQMRRHCVLLSSVALEIGPSALGGRIESIVTKALAREGRK